MARRPRRGARRAAGGPAPRDPPARDRRPELRGRGRRARHEPAGRAGARLARAEHAAKPDDRRTGGDPMSALPPHLARLGDALERAAARDLRRTGPLGAPTGRRRVPRRLLLVAAALAVGGSTAAAIATQLVS